MQNQVGVRGGEDGRRGEENGEAGSHSSNLTRVEKAARNSEFQCKISQMPLERELHLYGWDARAQLWHGPTALDGSRQPDKRLVKALRASRGSSWYGPVHCCDSGEPATR